jgi:15-cis-phytoene synthase
MTTSLTSVSDTGRTPSPVDDARHCAQIVREHARTFALASSFLPPPKRRAAFALYAFCRVADDMVDRATVSCDRTIGRQLESYHASLDAALDGAPSGPVFRELARAVRTFHVPVAVMHELIDGVRRDLSPVHYQTWDDLAVYCEGVASTVGEMCTFVFGVPAGPEARMRALRYARTLGLAMQLTNILRDVGEDARQGRCYLPDEDLAMFGLTREEVLQNTELARDERWRPFMAFEIGRARALYQAAMPGIWLLAPDAQRCASACAWGYASILNAIERQDYDTVRQRAIVPAWRKASLLVDVWRHGKRIVPADAIADGPVIVWDHEAHIPKGAKIRLA